MFSQFLSNINPIVLAETETAKEKINTGNGTEVAAATVSGLCVVFACLILLILFVWLYGKIFDSVRNNKKKTEVKPASVPQKADPETISDVSDDTDQTNEEIVAAISAVIAQISSETGVNYAVKSIKPARKSNRNAWGFEGREQNTSPF